MSWWSYPYEVFNFGQLDVLSVGLTYVKITSYCGFRVFFYKKKRQKRTKHILTFYFDTTFWLAYPSDSVSPPIPSYPGRWGTSAVRSSSPTFAAADPWKPSAPSSASCWLYCLSLWKSLTRSRPQFGLQKKFFDNLFLFWRYYTYSETREIARSLYDAIRPRVHGDERHTTCIASWTRGGPPDGSVRSRRCRPYRAQPKRRPCSTLKSI